MFAILVLIHQFQIMTIEFCHDKSNQVARGCNEVIYYNTTNQSDGSFRAEDLHLEESLREKICQAQKRHVSSCHIKIPFKYIIKKKGTFFLNKQANSRKLLIIGQIMVHPLLHFLCFADLCQMFSNCCIGDPWLYCQCSSIFFSG